MNSSNDNEKRSNVWRDILIGVVIAVIGGVIVAYLIQEGGRFQPSQDQPTTPNQNPTQNLMSVLVGAWSGTISNPDGEFSAELTLFFRSTCNFNGVCGTYDVPSIHCSGNLILVDMNSDSFVFLEQITSSDCSGSGYQHIDKLPGNSISYGYSTSGNPSDITTQGILVKK